jgi:hypothetical protein
MMADIGSDDEKSLDGIYDFDYDCDDGPLPSI